MSYYRNPDKRKRSLSNWPHVITTVFVCLFCWVIAYVKSSGFPLPVNDAVIPFWGAIRKWMINKEIAYAAGLLLIALIAFIIQRINDIEMLIRERTRLVFLLFLLLSSTNASILPFNNITIVLMCFVLIIYELFNTFQLPESKGKLFNVGVYIGVASLFMPQTLWCIPLLWLGMYQLFSLNYRSFMISLLGILTIYWIVFTWCVWKHDFTLFTMLFKSLTDFQLFSVFRSLRFSNIGYAMVAVMVIPIFLLIKMDAISNRLRVRQILSFLLNMSVWSLALTCLYGKNAELFMSLLYLPLSVLMAYFFEKVRNIFHFLLYYFILVLNVVSFVFRIWNY